MLEVKELEFLPSIEMLVNQLMECDRMNVWIVDSDWGGFKRIIELSMLVTSDTQPGIVYLATHIAASD